MTAAPDDREKVLLFSTLSILQLIKEAQQQHGLRHGDYQRYRSYCSRKLRRIRKSLHVTYVHKFKAQSIQARTLAKEQIKDCRYLLLFVYRAERCWTHAMQLKQEANTKARKKFHVTQRLRKAAVHSQKLEDLCLDLDAVDAKTKLEAKAYNAWMHGCLQFEEHQWPQALDSFSEAKVIYEKLARTVSADEGAVFAQRCTEMAPQLRYCQYNIGDQTAIADIKQMRLQMTDDVATSDLDALIAQTAAAEARAVKYEESWCGHKIATDKPSKVRMLYTSLLGFDAQLDSVSDIDAKTAVYERLLLECRDAIQQLRDESKNLNLDEGDELNANQLLLSYLTYIRLSKTSERYLLLIDSAWEQWLNGDPKRGSKPQDLVRLYETLLQNYSEMEQLPGARKDSALMAVLEAKISYFTAFRAYFLAEAVALLKKWPEVRALSERALKHALEAKKRLNSLKLPPGQMYVREKRPMAIESLGVLHDKATALKYTAYANSIAEEEESHAGTTDTVPLDTNLSVYRRIKPEDLTKGKCAPLTTFPPDFEVIPVKPMFFDLALNYVQFPNLDDKIEAEKPEEQKSGLTGLVKGLFWGKK